jgi:hypothetical protein
MSDDLHEKIRAKLDAPPAPPLEATREFLHSYVSDATSMDWVRQDVRRMIAINPRTVLQGLSGIERLLAEPSLPAGTLVRLVEIEGNRGLEEPTDHGARAWLVALAEMLRQELGDLAPPPLTA